MEKEPPKEIIPLLQIWKQGNEINITTYSESNPHLILGILIPYVKNLKENLTKNWKEKTKT